MDLISALLERGMIEANQARLIRQRQGALGGAIGDHLLEMGLIGYHELQRIMAEVSGCTALGGVELDLTDRATHRFLSAKIAYRNKVAPLCLIGRRLLLASSDPSGVESLFSSLRSAHQVEPELRVAAPFLVESLLAWLYGLPASEMSQGLCLRLTPRFYRNPNPPRPVKESVQEPSGKTQEPTASVPGLGDLMEQLRETEDPRQWLETLRTGLARWSPKVTRSRQRPRGLRDQNFLAPIPGGEQPLLWLSSQGAGRRLDRVRRQRLESLVRLLQPEFMRMTGLGQI